LFYEIPASDELKFMHNSGKVGRIIVDGGIMIELEIITELGWIVLGEHQWSTIFPSKANLSRLSKIKDIAIAHKACFLHFKECNATTVDNFEFQEVWVRISGCPYKLRCDYIALFAVGSLLGKAKEVDMEFTRANDVVRMLVQCTNVAHIPDGTDLSYDGTGYGIYILRSKGGSPNL
jgi:hypothetical protein